MGTDINRYVTKVTRNEVNVFLIKSINNKIFRSQSATGPELIIIDVGSSSSLSFKPNPTS